MTRSLEPGTPLAAQLAKKVTELAGAELKSWMTESCTGSYPLAVAASSRASAKDVPNEGQYIVLTVELALAGAPWIGAAPLIVGKPAL